MPAVKLSVVIITFNEERNIHRCLESVKEIADDILVVDSYSTDKTESICHSFGARFVQHVFEGHIEQKNYAITLAKYPHILSLDADEALSPALIHSIKKIKDNWLYDGYYMNRLTNYCGKWIRHCGWYPDSKLRLWDSRKGKWGGVNPHDKYEMMDSTATTTSIEGDILHYSFYTVEEHEKQSEYFSEIASRALYAKGIKAAMIKRFFSPIAKFVGSYFMRMGFLDGYYGFVISKISAIATYSKYNKLHLLWKENNH